jgi:hypothetical protein
LLLVVLTHTPPQRTCGYGQTHWLLAHTVPPVHALLHAPQWFESHPVSTQAVPHCGYWGAQTQDPAAQKELA